MDHELATGSNRKGRPGFLLGNSSNTVRTRSCLRQQGQPHPHSHIAVGATVNGLGYASYLDLTLLGLSPRSAVNVLRPVGLFSAFQGHARFAFESSSRDRQAAARCITVTVAGYLMNLVPLTILVDRLGLAHQIAQLITLAAIVPTMFVLLRRVVSIPE